MDVRIVDVLAQLEVLLRHSHSVQRMLLELRSEAPPPQPAALEKILPKLLEHTGEMASESRVLTEIINELAAGVKELEAAR